MRGYEVQALSTEICGLCPVPDGQDGLGQIGSLYGLLVYWIDTLSAVTPVRLFLAMVVHLPDWSAGRFAAETWLKCCITRFLQVVTAGLYLSCC